MEHKYKYNWALRDTNFTKDKGKVFSCFACGGGSTMGYKLAGFDVIGCNEIDPRMNECYVANHKPKYNFLCDIRELVKTQDLPVELYNLDILDGSPPCSTFSIAGSREDAWGVEKKFKEGQKAQVLDTLFFDFIELVNILKPKVVVAENVKGLIVGEAMKYVAKIYKEFDNAGYYCQHFLLNGADMGLPQRRERVFFICLRKDISDKFLVNIDMFQQKPFIDMDFKESVIPMKEVSDYKGRIIPKGMRSLWEKRLFGDRSICEASIRSKGKMSMFNNQYCYDDKICPTLAAREDCIIHYETGNYLSKNEVCKVSSFPLDYDFKDEMPHYICGMSVPPIMMANIADRIYEQWLSKL